MRIYLETMGCQMNRLDSELVEGLLRSCGHEMVEQFRQAEVILFNTCSVRQHAEDKVFSRLGSQGQRKGSGKKIIVGVLGCMAQEYGPELRKKYPQVDIVCAPGQLARLGELIAAASQGFDATALDPSRCEKIDIAADDAMDAVDLGRDVAVAPSPSQAYVRVMRGCDKFCSYCIVPFVRGPQRSRDPGQIVEAARRLVEAGRREITLLGQTVNSYLWTKGDLTVRFSDLLARVSAIEGLRRLRFVTSHPIDFGDDVLTAMRDLPNVCEYIHCPAQSGSDAVLARMNRKYTRAQYDDLVARARAIVPGVVLAGDFIVGFPGETDDDHRASADLIRRSAYKNTFIFKYSPRPGTAAERRFADDIPDEVKRRRNNELLAVQEAVGLAHHNGYVGQSLEVLVEGPSPRAKRQAKMVTGEKGTGENGDWLAPSSGACLSPFSPPSPIQLVGRTRWDHIVIFDGSPSLANQYINVRIVKADSLTLFGSVQE